jgi:hypothetical protein
MRMLGWAEHSTLSVLFEDKKPPSGDHDLFCEQRAEGKAI